MSSAVWLVCDMLFSGVVGGGGAFAFLLGTRQSSAGRRWCVPKSPSGVPSVVFEGTRPRRCDRNAMAQPNHRRISKPRCCCISFLAGTHICHQPFAYPNNYLMVHMGTPGMSNQNAKHDATSSRDTKAATRQPDEFSRETILLSD